MPERIYEVAGSSNIQKIGYLEEKGELTVQFHKKGIVQSVYCYFNVPESVFDEFVNAPSYGKFFDTRIKGAYQYGRVK